VAHVLAVHKQLRIVVRKLTLHVYSAKKSNGNVLRNKRPHDSNVSNSVRLIERPDKAAHEKVRAR
jgi:hypothetical protein